MKNNTEKPATSQDHENEICYPEWKKSKTDFIKSQGEACILED